MKPWISRCLGTICLGSALALAARNPHPPETEVEEQSRFSRSRAEDSGMASSSPPARLPGKARGRAKDQSLATRLHGDRVVIVAGQVHSPGPVHLGAGTTLSSVIDRAGGATAFGSIKRVRLQRGAETRVLNLSLPEHRDKLLLPHDVVVVPEKMVYGN